MNRPPMLVRGAGSPLGAILLFVIYAGVVWRWYQGDLPWWLALGAVGAAGRTLSAVRRVRSYKAWRAEWEAMGRLDDAQRPTKKHGAARSFVKVAVAAVLLVAIPVGMAVLQQNNPQFFQNNKEFLTALTVLWLVGCGVLLYLAARFALFKPVRGIMRRATKRRKEKAEAAPVAWLVGRASSSPSRADAQRNLPEYSARLIEGQQTGGPRLVVGRRESA